MTVHICPIHDREMDSFTGPLSGELRHHCPACEWEKQDAVKNLALTATDASAQVDKLTEPSLVERLRNTVKGAETSGEMWFVGRLQMLEAAADRIEALEREISDTRMQFLSDFGQWEEWQDKLKDAEREADLLAALIHTLKRQGPSVMHRVDIGWVNDALAIAERRVKEKE